MERRRKMTREETAEVMKGTKKERMLVALPVELRTLEELVKGKFDRVEG